MNKVIAILFGCACCAGVLSAQSQGNSQCHLHFAVVSSNEFSDFKNGASPSDSSYFERTNWPTGMLLWWNSEGGKRYPELCESSTETANFVLVWEYGYGSGGSNGAPSGSGTGACQTTAIPILDDRGRVIGNTVTRGDAAGCLADATDASRTGGSPTLKDIDTIHPLSSALSTEHIFLSLYRLPIKPDSKPISKKEAASASNTAGMEPMLKTLRKEAKKLSSSNK